MSSTSSIGPFEEGKEAWHQYQEKLEQYFVANGIPEEKRRAVLLSTCGRATYQLISNLLAPDKPAMVAYDTICNKLKGHLDPSPAEIVVRFRFYNRSRRSEESIADYLAELRRLARDCNFGSSLDSMLRDRLVLGANDDAMQQKLFAERSLTLEKALSIAQAHESAAEGKLMVQTKSPEDLHFVQTSANTSNRNLPTRRCYRCLSKRHLASKCPFLERKCYKCSKMGHTAAACKAKAPFRQDQKVLELEHDDSEEA